MFNQQCPCVWEEMIGRESTQACRPSTKLQTALGRAVEEFCENLPDNLTYISKLYQLTGQNSSTGLS